MVQSLNHSNLTSACWLHPLPATEIRLVYPGLRKAAAISAISSTGLLQQSILTILGRKTAWMITLCCHQLPSPGGTMNPWKTSWKMFKSGIVHSPFLRFQLKQKNTRKKVVLSGCLKRPPPTLTPPAWYELIQKTSFARAGFWNFWLPAASLKKGVSEPRGTPRWIRPY